MEVSQTPMVRTMTSSTLNVIFLSIKITLKGGIEFKFYNSYQLGPKNPCIYGIGYKEQIYNSSPKKKGIDLYFGVLNGISSSNASSMTVLA